MTRFILPRPRFGGRPYPTFRGIAKFGRRARLATRTLIDPKSRGCRALRRTLEALESLKTGTFFLPIPANAPRS